MSASTETEPIDEDEQEEIISFAIFDFKKETEQTCKILKTVCEGASIASAICILYSKPEGGGGGGGESGDEDYYKQLIITFYPLYAFLMHHASAYIAKSANGIASVLGDEGKAMGKAKGMTAEKLFRKNQLEEYFNSLPWSNSEIISVVGISATLIQLVLFHILELSDALTWSLAVTNLMTLAVSTYFRHDTKRTLFSIRDLKASKYKFKAL